MSSDERYRVRENTGNPKHPPIDEVIQRTLERAASPRPVDHSDAHFDRYVRDAVDQFGESAVVECVRLTLTKRLTHRSAGAAAFGKDNYVWGINIGVAAITYLQDLHEEQNTSSYET
jgi:hypothetical protein